MDFFAKGVKKYKDINEVETKFNFKFPKLYSTKANNLLLDFANSESKSNITYDKNNIEECIAVGYCYCYLYGSKDIFFEFIDEIYTHSIKKNDKTIFYSDNHEIIYLKALAHGIKGEIDPMINLLKYNINKGHNQSALFLIDFYLIKSMTNEYHKYYEIYMRSNNKSYYEIYTYVKLKSTEFDYHCLINGIKNNEEQCFDLLLKNYNKDLPSLKKAFLEIGKGVGPIFDIYTPLLMERIKKDDPNFFTSLIQSKKEQETIFNNENNFWYGFGCGFVFMLTISILSK